MGSRNFSTVKCEEVAVYADTNSARDNEARHKSVAVFIILRESVFMGFHRISSFFWGV
jgi:hypothetical protein